MDNNSGERPMTGIPTQQTLAQWPRIVAHRVFVTPEMAAEWLASGNVENRAIRETVVNRYVGMMNSGEWKPTHQGVAFSSRRLIDGQHRLAAIVRANKPQWLVVFAEQPDEVFGVLDKGTNRNLRDEVPLPGPVLDTISWMAQTLGDTTQSRVVPPQYAVDVGNVMADTIALVCKDYSRSMRGRIVSSVRAAVTLRLFHETPPNRGYILDQWRAWTHLDYGAMTASLHSAAKRMERIGSNGREENTERACVAWIAFDPRSRNLSKIVIRDQKNIVDEMRDVFNAAMAG
jgi:hypothetical protein